MNLKKIIIIFLSILNIEISLAMAQSDNLLSAVEDGNKDEVLRLIELGININKKNELGETALMLACQRWDTSIVELLLNSGANINQSNRYDQTPLILATQVNYNNNSEIIKLLINKGADVDIEDVFGETALTIASKYYSVEIVELLFKSQKDIAKKSGLLNKMLFNAVDRSYKELIQLLLDLGADINSLDKEGNTPLINAVTQKSEKKEFINFLIQMGANVNAQGKKGSTALMKACDWSRDRNVQLLIELGADIDIKNNFGKTAFDIARREIFQDTINLFIRFFKKKIYEAIKENNYDNFKKYILKLGTICFKDKDGNNLLHYAFKENNIELAKLIYYLNPELIAQENNSGQIPLSFISNELTKDFIKISLSLNNNKRKREE